MNPNISVIIPTYNRKNFLIQALHSVFNQSYPHIQILVIDDGSSDDTKIAIQPLLKNKNLSFYQQNHQGVSQARNLGIQFAHGQYISFLDSDDLWLKHKILKQIQFLTSQTQYLACYTNEIWIRNGLHVNPKKKHQKFSGSIYTHCLPLCIISPSSILFKSSILKNIQPFDPKLPACEDYDFFLRMAAQFPIYFLNQKLIVKQAGHPHQLSQKYPIMDQFRIYSLLKILQSHHSQNLSFQNYQKTIKTLIQKCQIVKNGCLRRQKYRQAFQYSLLIQKYSKKLSPSSPS